MGLDQDCSNSGLQLALGLALTAVETTTPHPPPSSGGKADNHVVSLNKPSEGAEPRLTLGLSGEISSYLQQEKVAMKNKVHCEDPTDLSRQSTSTHSHSAVSTFSCGRVKRERDVSCEEERVSSRVSDEDEDGTNARKKLRLTKQQSALLEDSFKQHSTLNPKQKQALARQLNLRTRQVEVWFQNRRARTKLKQTEVDREFLKKCCETLTDENRRLKKEVAELKALKVAHAMYMPMPAATLAMCPSCERLAASNTMVPSPHFYNRFTNPSAAC